MGPDMIVRRTFNAIGGFSMPLTRLNDRAFAASLAGVGFDMTDGSRTVHCMDTYAALQDKFTGLTIAGCVEAFAASRYEIEAIAIAKFDAAGLNMVGAFRAPRGT